MGSRTYTEVDYTSSNTTVNQDNRIGAGDNAHIVSVDGGSYTNATNTAVTTTTTTNNVDNRSFTSVDAGVITAAGGALGAASTAVAGVLPFLQSAASAQSRALSEYRDSLENSYAKFAADTSQMFRDGNSRAAAAEQNAYSFSRNSLDNILNFGRDSLNNAENQSTTALAAIRQTSSTLLDYITQREKDPNERAFSQVVPWLVGGAVILGIFAFGSNRK